MSSRIRVALVILLALVAAMLVPGRSDADPAVTNATCRATAPMVGRGTVTVQVTFPTLTFPMTVEVPEIGTAISDSLSNAELPLPIPTDIDAPSEIAPGATVAYAGELHLDLGVSIDEVMGPVRDAIIQAGYPDLASTLAIRATAEEIQIPFLHPTDTHALGAPAATGTGVSASFVGNTTVLQLDSVGFDTTNGAHPIDASVAWTVAHDVTATAPLDLRLGTTSFDLDIDVAGSVPGELVRPMVPAQFQSFVPDVVPVTGGATGPWACVPDDPALAIATTAIVDPTSTSTEATTSTTTEEPDVCTSGFTDVEPDHAFCAEITWFAGEGLTTGFFDGTYRPAAPVTRQAIAAMFYRAAGEPIVPADAPTFSDVPPGHRFVDEIRWLASEKITTGYGDGTFKPTTPITRQGIAAMFHRAEGEPPVSSGAPRFTDVSASHPFVDAIRWLAAEKITTGYADHTFRPGGTVVRQSAAAFFQRWSA